jgi:acetyl-CoA C-acetyltransferase
MREAVIVSVARSPIGRAVKGSLVSMRPDDLAAQRVRAALYEVPELNPADIDDLILGCGLPGGEQGFNIARTVAIQLGTTSCQVTPFPARYHHHPLLFVVVAKHPDGVTRHQGRRGAGIHLRRGGDRLALQQGQLRLTSRHAAIYADAQARTKKLAQGGQQLIDPRENGLLRRLYRDGADSGERRSAHRH